MIRVSVFYPSAEGATFDHDYYRENHVPLCVRTWSPVSAEIDKGIDGPHVILTSATSWIPGSSFYHVPIRPTAVLGQSDDDRDALRTSTMAVRPMRSGGNEARAFGNSA